MKLSGGDVDVTLTLLELENTPSVAGGTLRLDIQFSTAWFSVQTDVWVDRADWERFVADLHLLEKSRRGEAVLGDVGESEMRFRLFAIDRAGHIATDVRLRKAGRPDWSISLHGAELDSERLWQFVREAADAIDDLARRQA